MCVFPCKGFEWGMFQDPGWSCELILSQRGKQLKGQVMLFLQLYYWPIREAKKLFKHRTVPNFLSRCNKTSEQWSYISFKGVTLRKVDRYIYVPLGRLVRSGRRSVKFLQISHQFVAQTSAYEKDQQENRTKYRIDFERDNFSDGPLVWQANNGSYR